MRIQNRPSRQYIRWSLVLCEPDWGGGRRNFAGLGTKLGNKCKYILFLVPHFPLFFASFSGLVFPLIFPPRFWFFFLPREFGDFSVVFPPHIAEFFPIQTLHFLRIFTFQRIWGKLRFHIKLLKFDVINLIKSTSIYFPPEVSVIKFFAYLKKTTEYADDLESVFFEKFKFSTYPKILNLELFSNTNDAKRK